MLSDELWRAEATSGILLCSMRRVFEKMKVLWGTVANKVCPRLHFSLANLCSLLGVVRCGISAPLCVLQKTILSFLHLTIRLPSYLRTFLATFDMTVAPVDLFASSIFDIPRRSKILFPVYVQVTANLLLSARGIIPQRLPFILIAPLVLLYFISSLAGGKGLEPHMTPRRICRVQKNIHYHYNDL